LRLGALIELRGIATRGTSILAQLERGSLLFDFGFECDLKNMQAPKFAILTHAHKDHSGGLRDVLNAKVPILLSESVYWQLIDRKELSDPAEQKLCFPLTLPCRLHMGDGAELKLTAGAHTPGAMMARLTTSKQEQILFPGDYCLRNAYYQQHPNDLVRQFAASDARRLLLLDGTFLGYDLKDHTISTLESLEAEIRKLHERRKTVAFLAQSADFLYMIYIWLFRNFYAHGNRSGSRWLVVDDRLQNLLDSTFADIHFRRHKQRDPFIRSILGGADANYVETVRLYPLENATLPIDLPPPFDVFCCSNHIEAIANQLGPETHFFLVGHLRSKFEAMCRSAAAERPWTRLDGCDFAFHSSPQDIGRIIEAASADKIVPIIFHNRADRVRSALSEVGVGDKSYDCLLT
jgi:glyoxylase-like metal-dependent hydrolase (beta-lactamase superfamily II)